MCDERERLLDYLYDACDADERRRVDVHLETCETCREEISSLRSVRLSLLAWDVPEHGSVWTPFVPTRVRPWWREVPTWALAAAAGIMFVLGMAGGLVSRALMPAAAVAAAPGVTTAVEEASLEQRIERRVLGLVDARMDARLQPVAAHTQQASVAISRDDLMKDFAHLLETSEERQKQALTGIVRAWVQDASSFASKSDLKRVINDEIPVRARYEAQQVMQLAGGR